MLGAAKSAAPAKNSLRFIPASSFFVTRSSG
jgi:hypothetical protein